MGNMANNGRIRYLGDTSNFAPSPEGEGWDEGLNKDFLHFNFPSPAGEGFK
jgi:hypothetical protein